MRRSSKMVKSFGGMLGRITSRLGGVRTALIGLAGGAGFGMMIKRSYAVIDTLAKTAHKLGMTTDALQALQHAASLAGMETSQFNKALQKMMMTIGELQGGTGEAKQALDKLGLSAVALAKMTPTDMLGEFAEALAKVEDYTLRAEYAAKIFGARGGVAMLNMMKDGRAAMDASRKALEEFGLTITDAMGAKVEAANDSITNFRTAVEALSHATAVATATGVKKFVDALTGLAINLRRMSDETKSSIVHYVKWTGIIIGAAVAVKVVVSVIKKLVAVYKTLAKAQAIQAAFAGPKGWAMIAAGAVAATGALVLVDKVFASIGSGIGNAIDVGAEFTGILGDIKSGSKDAADALLGMAKASEAAQVHDIFSGNIQTRKDAVLALQKSIESMSKSLSEQGRTVGQLAIKQAERLTKLFDLPERFLVLVRELGRRMDALAQGPAKVIDKIRDTVAETARFTLGFRTAAEIGAVQGLAAPAILHSGRVEVRVQRDQLTKLDSIDKTLATMERRDRGLTD